MARDQFAAYQKLFSHFNRELFGGRLGRVSLVLSNRTRGGYYTPERWEAGEVEGGAKAGQVVGTQKIGEIGLSSDYLRRPPQDLALALVCQMIHQWQHLEGQPGRLDYHNAEWRAKAQSLGLDLEGSGRAIELHVVPGGPFDKAFSKLPQDAFPLLTVVDGGKKNALKRKVTYCCPRCRTKVWGRNGLDLLCSTCRSAFIPQ